MTYRTLLLIFVALGCGARSALELPAPDTLVALGGSSGITAGGGNAQAGTTTESSTVIPLPAGGSKASGGATARVGTDANAGPCVESMCTSGGWCWLNPLPQGNSLFDTIVHEGELWAIGDDGLVLRGDAEHWLRCPTPTTESLRGSWFSPSGVLWIVGTGGVVLSFDGTSWTQYYAEAGLFLNDVNGSGDDDIWVVGDNVVLHFDGQNWRRQTIDTKGSVYSVWANARDDIWVGGSEIWHFDGAGWRMVYQGSSPVRAVWGDNAGSLWFAGTEIVRCELLACSPQQSRVGEQFDVWGTGPSDIWTLGGAGGMHWNGADWSTFEVPTSLTSMSGGTPYGLVAVGHFGRMYYRKGSEWVELRRTIGSIWTDVWGIADDDIWISGNSMAHFNGRDISLTATPTNWGLQTVYGVGSADVWAVGCNGTAIHWDGHTWSDFSIEPWSQEDVCLWSVWGNSSDAVLATGSQGIVFRWDGSTWREGPALPSAATSRGLLGTAQSVLAIDDLGSVWQANEVAWQPVFSFASARLNAIWGVSNSDFWVVGEYAKRGHVLHWQNGTAGEWQVDTTTLTGASGTSASDVWLTGDGNEYHFDGQGLVEHPSGVHISNSRLWVSPAGTRWMVGGNGILRHSP